MAYRLITGATGLLGSYLLRDLLLRGEPVVALVRPSRLESAEQRVDGLLARFEETWRRTLPRPVILQGDITQPLLGLDAGDRRWLRNHADRILHSAASLTFQEQDGEPWASNVRGVQYVLDLCRETGIRLLEHISTAYVAGLRHGQVLETELDEGQEFGNDYERSKVQAEKLVRSDPHLAAYTIFRPSIIVGDSVSGFTSTFHGFYTPLRVAAALLNSVGLEQALEVDYLTLLGLSGHERKNFVPVDWVSDALVTLLARGEPAGRTYALVSDHPVTAARLKRVFEDSVQRHRERIEAYMAARSSNGGQNGSVAARSNSMDLFRKNYVEQFAVYRSYWRDDPDFDSANTRAAIPEVPCPEVTDEMLFRLCTFALDANFGFPRVRYEPPDFLPREWLRTTGKLAGPATTNAGRVGLTVTGPGGGSWSICANGSESFSYSWGTDDSTALAQMTSDTFHQLVNGHVSLDDALGAARLVLYGDQAAAEQLRAFVRAAVARTGS